MPEHGRVRARAGTHRAEAGFSLIELIIVMIIGAILIATVLPKVFDTRQRNDTPQVSVAAGAIWRGVQNYRMENAGAFPPASMLANSGSTFVNPGNGRYIQRWPEDAGGQPMVVQNGTGAPPGPTTNNAAWRGRVVYMGNGVTGWLVGVSSSGTVVYRRSVGTWGAAPIG